MYDNELLGAVCYKDCLWKLGGVTISWKNDNGAKKYDFATMVAQTTVAGILILSFIWVLLPYLSGWIQQKRKIPPPQKKNNPKLQV